MAGFEIESIGKDGKKDEMREQVRTSDSPVHPQLENDTFGHLEQKQKETYLI